MPQSNLMTPLGVFEPVDEAMTEEEAAFVLRRNQALALDWRKKANGLQDYVRKIHE